MTSKSKNICGKSTNIYGYCALMFVCALFIKCIFYFHFWSFGFKSICIKVVSIFNFVFPNFVYNTNWSLSYGSCVSWHTMVCRTFLLIYFIYLNVLSEPLCQHDFQIITFNAIRCVLILLILFYLILPLTLLLLILWYNINLTYNMCFRLLNTISALIWNVIDTFIRFALTAFKWRLTLSNEVVSSRI